MTLPKHLVLFPAGLLACLCLLACSAADTPESCPDKACPAEPQIEIDPDRLLEEASKAREEDMIGEAIKVLNKGLEGVPDDPRFTFSLGICHLAMGEQFAAEPESGGDPAAAFHDAQSYFEKTLALDPDHDEAERCIAQCLFLNNDLDTARTRIDAHLNRKPDDAIAHLLAGQILVTSFAASGDDAAPMLVAAESHLEKTVSLEPTLEAAYASLGDCRIYAGNNAGALAAFQEGIRKCPEPLALHQRLLATFAGSDVLKNEDAAVFYRGLLERTDLEAAEQGLLWWYLGEWLEKDGTAFYGKGGAYAEAAALYAETASAFMSCSKAYPPYASDGTVRAAMAYCSEGWAHYNLSDFESSEKGFFKALGLYPNLDTAVKGLDYLGTAIVNTNGAKDACDFFKRAAEATPGISKFWNNHAFFAREVEQYEDAYRGYVKAVEISPDDTRYINDCGMMLMYYLKRDPEQTEKYFRQAWETGDKKLENPFISDEDRAYHFEAQCDAILNLGRLLLVQNRVEECDPIVKLLLDKAPQRLDVQELRIGHERAKNGTPYSLPE